MKASELRIGNYVWEDYGGVYLVRGLPSEKKVTISKTKTTIPVDFKIEESRPIPLTEEWLLKFGFEEIPVFVSGLWLIMEADLSFRFVKNYIELWDLEKIKTFYDMKVHQLQNLYFAITGEELTIK